MLAFSTNSESKVKRLKLTTKPLTSKINIDSLKENKDQDQESLKKRLFDQITSVQLVKIIMESAKKVEGQQQRANCNKLSKETKNLLKK